MIEIKETNIKDIDNVQRLWADGDVMRFVGFPNGLHQTSEEMKGWFQWIESNRPVLNHYSIFENGNYCGESFYEIDEEHCFTPEPSRESGKLRFPCCEFFFPG